MRLIFAGTPEFAAQALDALVAAGHEVALVLTQPDRPAGRGQQPLASPVKRLATAHGLPVAQPPTLRDPAVQQQIAAVGADAMIVAAYGLILPQAVLDLPRHGCINIHASLLPRWRGAAPIQRAIEAGDDVTGITIMRMEAGLDTGPMLLAESVAIGPDDSAGSLHDRLASLGARLVVDALARLGQGGLVEVAQPAEGVTYAAKIGKAEAAIDWRLPARDIERRIRAFDPFPGAQGAVASRPQVALKIWRAQVVRPRPVDGPLEGRAPDALAPATPGVVLEAGPAQLVVACGQQALALLELQKPGGRRLPAVEFLRGFPLSVGERFALPDA